MKVIYILTVVYKKIIHFNASVTLCLKSQIILLNLSRQDETLELVLAIFIQIFYLYAD